MKDDMTAEEYLKKILSTDVIDILRNSRIGGKKCRYRIRYCLRESVRKMLSL